MARSTPAGPAHAPTVRMSCTAHLLSASRTQRNHSTGMPFPGGTFPGGNGTTRKRGPHTSRTGKGVNGGRRRHDSGSSQLTALRPQTNMSAKRQEPDASWPHWLQHSTTERAAYTPEQRYRAADSGQIWSFADHGRTGECCTDRYSSFGNALCALLGGDSPVQRRCSDYTSSSASRRGSPQSMT
jgi:hypothetical protein